MQETKRLRRSVSTEPYHPAEKNTAQPKLLKKLRLKPKSARRGCQCPRQAVELNEIILDLFFSTPVLGNKICQFDLEPLMVLVLKLGWGI